MHLASPVTLNLIDADVGCSVRKQADAERISAEVAALPGQFTPLIFDVTDAEAVQAAAREVGAALSGANLSALINNAGKVLLSLPKCTPRAPDNLQFCLGPGGLHHVASLRQP